MRDKVKQFFVEKNICSESAAEDIVSEMMDSGLISNKTDIPKLAFGWLEMVSSQEAIREAFWNRPAKRFEIKDFPN